MIKKNIKLQTVVMEVSGVSHNSNMHSNFDKTINLK